MERTTQLYFENQRLRFRDIFLIMNYLEIRKIKNRFYTICSFFINKKIYMICDNIIQVI